MGTAKVTFDKAIDRAEYLLRLAEGLTDHRQRGARADWGRSFKALMHWPKGHVIERVDSKDVVVVIRDGSTLSRDDFSTSALDDLLRASLVMAVAAMDAYFHAKILRYVVSHSRKASPSGRLLNERILVSDFIEGRKRQRANTALRAALERNLSYQSLQHPEKIADALGLIGVCKFWDEIAKALKRAKKDLCDEIGAIVRRRNQIAHEGDLSQSKKARNQDRSIANKYVRDSITTLKQFVDAADVLINSKVT